MIKYKHGLKVGTLYLYIIRETKSRVNGDEACFLTSSVTQQRKTTSHALMMALFNHSFVVALE